MAAECLIIGSRTAPVEEVQASITVPKVTVSDIQAAVTYKKTAKTSGDNTITALFAPLVDATKFSATEVNNAQTFANLSSLGVVNKAIQLPANVAACVTVMGKKFTKRDASFPAAPVKYPILHLAH